MTRGAEASSSANDAKRSARLVVGLLSLAFASGLLAVVQWFELIRSYDGVEAFCAIGERLNCSTVWGSAFAKTVHRWTGMPLAAWGLVWSVAALVAALAVSHRWMVGRDPEGEVASARWVGVGGAVASLAFFAVSLAIGAFCITCVATYGLVALYAVLAFRLPAASRLSWSGVRLPVAAVLGAYLLLLYPGLQTPTSAEERLRDALPGRSAERPSPKPPPERRPARENTSSSSSSASTPLETFLAGLPGPARLAVMDALEAYRRAQPIQPGDRFGQRPIVGKAGAPVHIVDFVDVACGHCANLMDNLALIRRELPGVPFSVETRYFPLDGACNDVVGYDSGDALSVRCLGPKLLLCAQDGVGYPRLKKQIFDHHSQLSADALYRWASEATGRDRAELEACVRAPDTQAKLAQDVAFGQLYNPRGTPLVVVNGREASPLPPFLYAIVLAGGDPEAAGFESLGM